MVASDFSAIVAPFGKAPMRLPTSPDTRPTTAVRLDSVVNATVGTTGYRLAFHRSPVAPVWYDGTSNGVYVMTHSVRAREVFIVAGTTTMGPIDAVDTTTTSPVLFLNVRPPTIVLPGGSTNITPAPFAMLDNTTGGGPWAYVPAGAGNNGGVYIMYSNFQNFGAAITAMLEFDTWSMSGEIGTARTGLTVGVAGNNSMHWSLRRNSTLPSNVVAIRLRSVITDTGTATTDGVFSLICTNSFVSDADLVDAVAGVAPVLTISATYGGCLIPAAVATGSTTSMVPYQNSRLTALGVKIRNVTKVMNKEGSWYAARLDTRTFLPFNFDLPTIYEALASRDKAVMSLAEDITLFLPPATSQLEFRDHFYNPNALSYNGTRTTTFAVFRLDDMSLMTAMQGFDADGGTGLLIHVCSHFEFRHTSPWWATDLCSNTLESFHRAAIQAAMHPVAREVRTQQIALTHTPNPPPRSAKQTKQQKKRTTAPWPAQIKGLRRVGPADTSRLPPSGFVPRSRSRSATRTTRARSRSAKASRR